MRILFEIFMIAVLVIFILISYASFVSAAYDSPEPPPQPQQQRLPFCDEDKTQQNSRNAGYFIHIPNHSLVFYILHSLIFPLNAFHCMKIVVCFNVGRKNIRFRYFG